jgi:Uma2 family endonuclease
VVDTVAPPHRLTFDDVLRMVEAGILDEDDRVELVNGVLVDMSPISPEHSGAVAWLNQHFAGTNTGAWEVRAQDQLVLRDGLTFVQPDLILIEPAPRSRLATTALLVVEVANTSQRRDREKARDYADAAVPEYWLVDLPAQNVTVFRDPVAGASDYGTVTVHGGQEQVSPLVGGAPVSVAALLGL